MATEICNPLRVLGHICNWETRHHESEYGLEIPANFVFLWTRKGHYLQWLKNKITKTEENLNQTVKYCLK